MAGSLVLAILLFSSGAAAVEPEETPIDHIIVIYQENHTFDNLYGNFPGANGLNASDGRVKQVNKEGEPYKTLPQPLNDGSPGVSSRPPGPDQRFPDDLPNEPFPINRYAPLDQLVAAPVHRFYQHQLQMNGGKMNRFVAWTNAGGLTMGYNDTKKLPLYPYARSYTLADNFFSGAIGESMLNHFWLFCACTPVWRDAPEEMVARPEFDSEGNIVGLPKDGEITPDGHVVNDIQPSYHPYNPEVPADRRMPPQTFPTIGDRLSDAGVSWVWYAGGWDEALAGKAFDGEHPAPVYFKQYADGTRAKAEHLKVEKDFIASLGDGSLPAVSFITQLSDYDEHAGYSTISASEQHAVDLIERVKDSRYWEKTAIIITYDDYGGWYDHVAPPKKDRWGPGGRIPTLIISPHARKGYVDHTLYDTTSILKFIEWRHGLKPLAERDAEANNLLAAFDFDQPPADPPKRSKGPGDGSGVLVPVAGLAAVVGIVMLLGWRARRGS